MLGWRDTPVEGRRNRTRGARLAALYRAVLRGARLPDMSGDEFERKLYVVRKRVEAHVAESDMRDKSVLLYSFVLVAHDHL